MMHTILDRERARSRSLFLLALALALACGDSGVDDEGTLTSPTSRPTSASVSEAMMTTDGSGGSSGDASTSATATATATDTAGRPEPEPDEPPPPPACSEDETVCAGVDSYQACEAGEVVGHPIPCPPSTVCVEGSCTALTCASAGAAGSHAGCEFWASELPMTPVDDLGLLAVMVGNPGEAPAEVSVYDGANELGGEPLGSTIVGPGANESILLAGAREDEGLEGLYPERLDLVGSGALAGRGFRIRASRPVTATLRHNAHSGYTDDTALLLPTHRLGRRYTAAGWGDGIQEPGRGSFVVLVAAHDGTEVEVQPTHTIAASQTTPFLPAGQFTKITLERHDVVHLQGEHAVDLTGTLIESSRPIAAFSGHSCAFIPTSEHYYCDLLSEQLVPRGDWGREFIAARAEPRYHTELYRWRLIAREDETTVEFDPPGSLGELVIANAGEWYEFTADEHVHVSADAPIQLVGYMRGGHAYFDIGDPHMVQMPPVSQFRSAHLIHSYTDFNDLVRVVRPAGAGVTLECGGPIEDEHWEPVGAGDYEVAIVPAQVPGCPVDQERVLADAPVGVVLSGTAQAVSYAHAAHL